MNSDEGYDEIDESTAVGERRRAEARVEAADTGAQRTRSALLELNFWISNIAQMHEENHYVERLRPIWQGGHRD